MNEKPIAIIGAGIAGIASAMQLAEYGEKVLIVESRPHIGGRFYSFIDPISGEWIDNGQHVMVGAYDNFLQLISTLGTKEYLYIPKALHIPFYSSDGKKDVLDTSSFSGKAGLVSGLLRMQYISIKSKIEILSFFSKLQFNLIKSESLTAFELLQREKQGADAIYWFWEPLILATMNLSLHRASANLFIKVLKKSFYASKGKSSLIFSTVPFAELLSPFKNWIENKRGTLQLNTSVKKIIIDKQKAKSIILSNGDKVDVKAIISAVQPYQLMKMVDRQDIGIEFATLLNDFEYSSIISIYFWLDRNFLSEDFVALLGTIPQWIFNLSNIYSKKGISKGIENKIAITISQAETIWSINNQKLSELCWNDITLVLTQAKSTKVLRSKIIRERFATIKANPKAEIIRRRLKDLAVENLILAGDWTNQELPSTLESAAISGKYSAESALSIIE